MMGLLDQILGGVLGGQAGGLPGAAGAGGAQGNLMQLVLQLVNSYPGGLQGLIAQFGQAGLGQQAQSWVGTGQNQSISAEQLMQALGSGPLQSLASQFGLDHQQAASGLAGLLPDVIDKLTPSGQVQDQDISAGLDLLRGKLFG
jgi:uncharacterized protein YidB (DUF937 family)